MSKRRYDKVEDWQSKLSKLEDRFKLDHANLKNLEGLDIVYKDAIRRRLEVSEVQVTNYKSGYSRIEFDIQLGDKPKIWGRVIEGIEILIIARLYPPLRRDRQTEIIGALRQEQTSELGFTILRHPHRMTGGNICTGVRIGHLITHMPWAAIPYAIQAASTVSFGYRGIFVERIHQVEVAYGNNP